MKLFDGANRVEVDKGQQAVVSVPRTFSLSERTYRCVREVRVPVDSAQPIVANSTVLDCLNLVRYNSEMARQTPTTLTNAHLDRADVERGIERLGKRLSEIKSFDISGVTSKTHHPALDQLKRSIEESLDRTFGTNTIEYNRYKSAASFYLGGLFIAGYDQDSVLDIQNYARESLESSGATIESAISALRERLEEFSDLPLPVAKIKINASSAFIVHGHENEPKEAIGRFLTQLGIKPIILHEQSSMGRTVIEKIEANSDVGFAIVLLTPDDVGSIRGGEIQPRARQNVILELGYFIAKLGRDRVCAIKVGEIEIPSDFNGVVYEEYDQRGYWKLSLARELRAVGYNVDLNSLV